VTLTNRLWRLDGEMLRRRFAFQFVRMVNDFAAVARALEVIAPEDLEPWRGGQTFHAGPRLAVGPGTGLGVAALIWSNARPTVVASEAGHVRFGPAEPDEDAVFARLRRAGPVSAECLLSGPGLARLHTALTGEVLAPAEIGARAIRGEASTCASVGLFSRLLGRFCGDMSLTFRAEGGLFLAGGVVRRLGSSFDRSAFLAAFDAHAPFEGWLSRRPIARIAAPEPGLLGCAAIARDVIAG
jgi:glucokinase